VKVLRKTQKVKQKYLKKSVSFNLGYGDLIYQSIKIALDFFFKTITGLPLNYKKIFVVLFELILSNK